MIEVDLTSLIPPEIMAMESVVAAVIPDIMEEVRAEIIRQAHANLGSSAQDYIAGIQPVVYHFNGSRIPSGEVATIELVGELPNMLENGWAGGDMKPALLAGRNAKTGAGGVRYNTVPFRHGTPGSKGNNFARMGSAYARGFRSTATGFEPTGDRSAAEAEKLGKAVYRMAKKLKPTLSHASGEAGPQHRGSERRLPEGLAPKLRPHHKTDIYAGMVRKEKTYQKAAQSSYSTFRRVSDNSDPQAWIHPGIEANHLFEEGAEYMQEVAAHIIETAISNASGS